MVRAVALLASTAAAMETTGLLQATVGLHNQLASDKVASMRKMEKEWEAKAMAAAPPSAGIYDGRSSSGSSLGDEDNGIYDTIKETMDAVLADLASEKKTQEDALEDLRDNVQLVNAEHNRYFYEDRAGFAGVRSKADAHTNCRGETQTLCIDWKTYCNDKVTLARNIIEDEEKHSPALCATRESTSAGSNTQKIIDSQDHALAWTSNTGTQDTSGTYPLTSGRDPTQNRMEALSDSIAACTNADTALVQKDEACDELQTTFEASVPVYQTTHKTYCDNSENRYKEEEKALAEAWGGISGNGGQMESIAAICHSAFKVKRWIDVIKMCATGPCDGAKEQAIKYDPTDEGSCNPYVIIKPQDPDAHNVCPELPPTPELGDVCSKTEDATDGYGWETVAVSPGV